MDGTVTFSHARKRTGAKATGAKAKSALSKQPLSKQPSKEKKIAEADEILDKEECDDETVAGSATGKRKVTKNPKVKPVLTKQSSNEEEVLPYESAASSPPVRDESAASSTSGKRKVAKNPKVNKPVLTKQPSKELNAAAEPKKATSATTYLDMVQEAIEAVGVPRKGASVQAIKKYIHDRKEDNGKTDGFIKKALLKGVEKGVFKQNTGKGGAVGCFSLVKPEKPKKKHKTLAKDSDDKDGHVSDSETFIKSKPLAHLRKRNLSDSAITTMTSSTPKPSRLKGMKPPPRKLVKAVVEPKKVTKDDASKERRRQSSDTEVVVKPKVGKTLKSASSDTELNLFSKTKRTRADDLKTLKSADTRTRKGEKAELLPPEQPKSRVRKLHNPDAKGETKKTGAVKSEKAKTKKKA